MQSAGKCGDVEAISRGIDAIPPIAAILQQHLVVLQQWALPQYCCKLQLQICCGNIAATRCCRNIASNAAIAATRQVLLQQRVAAILPQCGHCCNTSSALHQSAMPETHCRNIAAMPCCRNNAAMPKFIAQYSQPNLTRRRRRAQGRGRGSAGHFPTLLAPTPRRRDSDKALPASGAALCRAMSTDSRRMAALGIAGSAF